MSDVLAALRDSAQQNPTSAEAAYQFGNGLRDAGRTEEAFAAFVRATELRPGFAEAHNNLGNLRVMAGRHREALPHYAEALTLRPAFVDARFNLGVALQALDDLEAALATYSEVLRQAPTHAPAHNNAGEVCERLRRPDEAAQHYAAAAARNPRLPQPKRNLGTLLLRQGRIADALALFAEVVALQPRWTEGLASLVHAKALACEWTDFDALVLRLREAARASGGLSPFIAATLDMPSAEQTAAAIGWAATLDVPPDAKLPARPRERRAKLRVGYLSGDLHAHATAFLTAELFERHDRARFDVHAYSLGPDDGSSMRKRLIAGFDTFVDLRGLSDRQAAELIREDELDILVDLKGYTEGARPRILAYRPAPIQVNWLGFPGSMGTGNIDYVVADRTVAPPSLQAHCVERIVWLPDCFQPNDTRRERPDTAPSRAQCGLPETGFVFCCFNNSYKITPSIFAIWARLLEQLPGSVLWLLDTNPLVRANLRRAAARRGIAPARLVFAPKLPLADHLARLAAADLVLDTVPVNALTTASDALWVGVPIVTLMGDTVAGRGCASLLQAIGLPDLVTETPAAYEALALRLATEPAALRALRDRLRRNRGTMPLFDTPRFARGLEAAYRRMVELWLAGDPPQPFAVESP